MHFDFHDFLVLRFLKAVGVGHYIFGHLHFAEFGNVGGFYAKHFLFLVGGLWFHGFCDSVWSGMFVHGHVRSAYAWVDGNGL